MPDLPNPFPNSPNPPSPPGQPNSANPFQNPANQAPGALTLIGSGHVFQVKDTIRDAVVALRPDIVFVELDAGRLQVLLDRKARGGAPAPPPPSAGYVQKRLQRFQEQVAGLYGADVGEEMLAAVQAGQEVGARV